MKIIMINTRLTTDEKETILCYDQINKKWHMDTTISKHYNKARKQGWKQLVEYVYDDGTVCGGRFEAPSRAITIRSTEKKQMSDKQMQNLNGEC